MPASAETYPELLTLRSITVSLFSDHIYFPALPPGTTHSQQAERKNVTFPRNVLPPAKIFLKADKSPNHSLTRSRGTCRVSSRFNFTSYRNQISFSVDKMRIVIGFVASQHVLITCSFIVNNHFTKEKLKELYSKILTV